MKFTVRFATALALSATASVATAQTGGYVRAQYAAQYVPLTTGTVANFASPDDDVLQVPLGFAFEFFGEVYTHVNVSTNGVLVFASACSSILDCPFGPQNLCVANRCLVNPAVSAPSGGMPSTIAPDQIVAAWWDDLHLGAGSVRYATRGAAPDRSFVVEYSNVKHYPDTTLSTASFQVHLDERTGAVSLHYGPYQSNPNGDGEWSGTMGIEDESGMAGLVGLPCATNAPNGFCPYTSLQALDGQVIQFVVPVGPELTVRGSAPNGGAAGSAFSVSVTAENLGNAPTGGAFSARVYFSADDVVEPTDTLLGTVSFGNLGGASSTTQTLAAVVPSVGTGYYTIGAIVDPDDEVAETIETNNVGRFTTRFLVGADLSILPIAPAGSTGPGQTVVVPVDILNNGAANNAVAYRVYLSADTTLDAQDALVASATVAVPAQPITRFDTVATIPSAIAGGDYYVIAQVDPSDLIAEADETNNIGVSAQRTSVELADLVVRSVSAGSVFAFRGQLLEVTVRIENAGGADANGFHYAFYLSDNQLISAIFDPLLEEVGPISLAPGEQRTFTRNVVVPSSLAPGPYYLGAIADTLTAVAEDNPNNNIGRTMGTLEVRDPAPNLVPTRIRAPATAAAGESMSIARTIENRGNAPTSAEYEIVFSTDATIDDQDSRAGRFTATVAAGQGDSTVDVVVVPSQLGAGDYYVGYVVDPDGVVDELFEDDNVAVSAGTVAVLASPLEIRTTSLPLGTLGVPYDVALAAMGGARPYTWSIDDGALPAGVTLSADGRLAGAPEEEGLFAVTIQVTDGRLVRVRDYQLLVAAAAVPLEIITRSLPPAFVHRAYRYPLTAFGGVPPFIWSEVGADGLPDGLVLEPDGALVGSPTITVLSALVVRVQDATGAVAEQTLTLRVVTSQDVVRFSSELLSDGRIGELYDEEVHPAMGSGVSPYTFTIVSGALPDGLTHERGRISGTPARVGDFSFTMRLVDGRGDFDVNRFVISIREKSGVLFSTTGFPEGFVGEPYVSDEGEAVEVRAVAGDSEARPVITLVSGNLPPGLSMDAEGVISGTPRSVGVFAFVLVAEDDLGQRSARAFGISVVERDVPVDMPLDDGCGCRATNASDATGWALLIFVGLLLLRRERALLFAVVLFVPLEASAQSYFTETFSAPYVSRTDLTTTTFPPPLFDDEELVLPIPFPFRFHGAQYTQVRVTTNGYATFLPSTVSFANTVLPATSDPNAMIALFWDDLEANTVSWGVDGASPNRVLTIQYEDAFPLGNATGGTPRVQLRLYEGQEGRFEIHYGGVVNMTDPLAWSASLGFEDATGGVGASVLSCNPNCSGADLNALADTIYRAREDVGSELVAAGVDAPEEVFEGVPFAVDVQIRSLSAAPLGAFIYELHLVPDGQTSSGNIVYLSAPVTLAPFSLGAQAATVTIPLNTPAGDYRLLLVVDPQNQIAEPDETNNQIVSNGVLTIASRRPNFVVDSVTTPTTRAAQGEPIDVTLILANRGNLAGNTAWAIRLSENEVITNDDILLDEGVVDLDLLSTATITRTVTIPANVAPGRHYVGAIVDPNNRVVEIDDLDNARSGSAITVTSDTLRIGTTNLSRAYIGIDYASFLFAEGGDGAFVWSVDAGSLPDGLALEPSTGAITGRATIEGRYDFTLRVDSAGDFATAQLAIEVHAVEGGITIVTRDLLPGVVGAAYPPVPVGATEEQRQRLVAVGGTGAYQFSLRSTPPPGLALGVSGVLEGVPLQAGVFELEVEVSDGVQMATSRLVLTVGEPGRLTLVAALLPDGFLSEDYTYQLQVIGRSPTSTVTFMTPGPLPDGLLLSPGGRIVGIPQGVGTREFVVSAIESGDGGTRDTASYRLSILHEGGFSITPSTLPLGVVGQPFDVELRTRSGTPPLTWRLIGPPFHAGLEWSVDADSGAEVLRISGTPEVTGLVSVLITVTDDRGRYAQAPYSLLVDLPPAAPVVEEGCVCARGERTWWAFFVPLLLFFRRR